MASSLEQICNLALIKIGHRELIDDLSEDSTEAQLCNELYEPCRDEVLEAFKWLFATKHATLAALATDPPTNWLYAYALPADFIAARGLVLAGNRAPANDQRIRYAIEFDATSAKPVLVTDQDAAELIYTFKATNVATYSPMFVTALAWRLAIDLALGLPVKPQLGIAAEAKYQQALRTAAASQLNQQQDEEPTESAFIRERS